MSAEGTGRPLPQRGGPGRRSQTLARQSLGGGPAAGAERCLNAANAQPPVASRVAGGGCRRDRDTGGAGVRGLQDVPVERRRLAADGRREDRTEQDKGRDSAEGGSQTDRGKRPAK